MNKEEIQNKINELEAMMIHPDFWSDKDRAQSIIREIQKLKTNLKELAGMIKVKL